MNFRKVINYSKVGYSSIVNYMNPKDLIYVIEAESWSIKWDGLYITKNLQGMIDSATRLTHCGLRDGKSKIVHFGSLHTYIPPLNYRKTKNVVTCFHIDPDARKTIAKVKDNFEEIDILHTSCQITKEILIDELDMTGAEKIKVIPLGVDHEIFRELQCKNELRKKYGIPTDKFVIGSFHKDGIGWGEGLTPKLIKGPDTLVDVLRRLSSKNDLFVLLTGPARGFVKSKLEKYDIPYRHFFINNYLDMNLYYNMIDAYLITSRAEGGPKGLIESMACKIPVVSTRVGMAHDIVKDGMNGYIAEIDDIRSLVEKMELLISNDELRYEIGINGFDTSLNFTWKKIAKRYFDELYDPLFCNSRL
ncbi:MAG: glycosyltransferase family 4 protein [Candidatus Odinarchaeota archaeon]